MDDRNRMSYVRATDSRSIGRKRAITAPRRAGFAFKRKFHSVNGFRRGLARPSETDVAGRAPLRGVPPEYRGVDGVTGPLRHKEPASRFELSFAVIDSS